MNATVTELIIPNDKLEKIRKIMNSKVLWYTRRDKLKDAAGFNPFCCVCHGISSPLYQVRYSAEGAVRVEVYCEQHIETYHKTKDSTSEELAAKYNCQIGEIPPTTREPWD